MPEITVRGTVLINALCTDTESFDNGEITEMEGEEK